MKKTGLIGFIVAAMAAVLLLSGCTTRDSALEKGISELRLGLFEGRGEFFDVSVMSGKREEPFDVDGVSEKMVDYCLISVLTAEAIPDGSAVTFTVAAGGKSQSGTLKEDYMTGRLCADIGKFDTAHPELNVTLSVGEFAESVPVQAKYNKNMLAWNDALSVAREALPQSFENAFIENDFYGEIFIRFVNSPVLEEDRYFWYIMLKDRNGTVSSALIAADSGEVASKHVT